jgi:23S rRNA pseudouridine1911/1915/1917 synthase
MNDALFTLQPAARGADATSDLSILYEDEHLLVAEKRSGLVVHPAYRHADGTFWDALVALFAARGDGTRPFLLHRLDRDTSGLLCVPKHADANRRLVRALSRGEFTKGYLALVHGWPPSDGVIDAPLARDPRDRRLVCVRDEGKPARTLYRALRRAPGYCLLRIYPQSGRTHQIRAHLTAIGHPIAGDPLYSDGIAPVGRLFLHADLLRFPHPYERRVLVCRSPLPSDLRRALGALASRHPSCA